MIAMLSMIAWPALPFETWKTTRRKLKVRAALNGRSMEQEAREILNGALREKPLRQKHKSGADPVKRIREIFEPLGGVELEPFPREPRGKAGQSVGGMRASTPTRMSF